MTDEDAVALVPTVNEFVDAVAAVAGAADGVLDEG